MTAPIPLVDLVLLVICPACNASGCRACRGVGRVPHDPYRRGGGEQGDDFNDLVPLRHGARGDPATLGRLGHEIPAAEPSLRVELEQLVERARVACPSCVLGGGECARCNGSGWVFAREAR